MKHQLVLQRGMLSEKIYSQMENGVYTFLVSRESTKKDIKDAIEKQFKVKVKSVNVGTKASKKKRVTGTRKVVDTGSGKKAVVHLVAGESIALLSPKTESKKGKKDKKETKNGAEKSKDEKRGLLSRIKGNQPDKEKEEKK